MKHFDVITIFPEMLQAVSHHGITRRALEDGLFGLKTWDPRDFTQDAYRRVDDRPYGGGPGMVMMAGPLRAAIDAAREVATAGTFGALARAVPARELEQLLIDD